jgi:hypothetical protein
VLHCVGHPRRLAVDARGSQRLVEQATGRPHEGQPLTILLVTGLLANEHHASMPITRPEHGLGRWTREIARRAPACGVTQRVEVGGVRNNSRVWTSGHGLNARSIMRHR